jgi:hypothetical protein
VTFAHCEFDQGASTKDVRYSPVVLRGQSVRSPPLRMAFPRHDEKTGRIIST